MLELNRLTYLVSEFALAKLQVILAHFSSKLVDVRRGGREDVFALTHRFPDGLNQFVQRAVC